jgi:hypothetical protein
MICIVANSGDVTEGPCDFRIAPRNGSFVGVPMKRLSLSDSLFEERRVGEPGLVFSGSRQNKTSGMNVANVRHRRKLLVAAQTCSGATCRFIAKSA